MPVTLREVPPEQTLHRIRAKLSAVGITRVANVTGLDCVGVPTWMVVRPMAKSLTVSQGKGITHALAQCSGIMESVELFHAENFSPATTLERVRECVNDSHFAPILRLPIRSDAAISEDTEIDWFPAVEIISGKPRMLPLELIDLNFARPPRGSPVFLSSSNGLASGNSVSEATLHGLCEVIERDQTCLWLLRRNFESNLPASRINPDSILDNDIQTLLDKCRAAGLSVYMWNCRSDIDVPTFACTVADPLARTHFPQQAAGYGTHPIKSIAALRAITEALQSRLTHVAGARDDLYWSRYRSEIPSRTTSSRRQYAMFDDERLIDYESIPELPLATIEDLVTTICSRLKSAGLEDGVLVADLHLETIDLPVVYVCVPGLETCPKTPLYTPGPRAIRLMEALNP